MSEKSPKKSTSIDKLKKSAEVTSPYTEEFGRFFKFVVDARIESGVEEESVYEILRTVEKELLDAIRSGEVTLETFKEHALGRMGFHIRKNLNNLSAANRSKIRKLEEFVRMFLPDEKPSFDPKK